MSVTVTFTFDTIEEAMAHFAPPKVVMQEIKVEAREFERPEPAPEQSDTPAAAESPQPGKKPRKPRSDAGQPRGPYKTTEKSEAPAAPATVPAEKSAAPEAAGQAAEPTIADVRAAMEVLSKKRGIEANMKALRDYGVQRVSELPAAKYGEFIAKIKEAAK